MSNGGTDWGAIVEATANVFDLKANKLNNRAGQASTKGVYRRRDEDWSLQLQSAEKDIEQITEQINAQDIRVKISEQELKNHEESIQQANEVESFLRDKFTNKELYRWMVSRISVVYFQTFKLAQETALAAQKAYQFELNREDTYIAFDYWDGLKKGLLAGEGLMLGISNLEKAYIHQNKRQLEIEKTLSLKNHLDKKPEKNSKVLEFSLSEELFDKDFENHYNRRIKSISITIPAVVGPYENINATLTQLNNTVYTKPGKNSSDVRKDWRKSQRIAISRGVNDSGLFELNLRDERYLPFEGTGVESEWRLTLSDSSEFTFDFEHSIPDVILRLQYTALE